MTRLRVLEGGATAHPGTDWMDHAACRGAAADVFFLDHGAGPADEARTYCDRCPVREDCLDYALANGEQFGIWGGLTLSQRLQVRRARIRASRDAELAAIPTPPDTEAHP